MRYAFIAFYSALMILGAWYLQTKKPTMTLEAAPRTSMTGVKGYSVIRITLKIKNIDEEWYCPEVTWYWPNETESSYETLSCPPWEESEYKDRQNISETRYVRFGAGYHNVAVSLSKNGKIIKKINCQVIVRGDEDEV